MNRLKYALRRMRRNRKQKLNTVLILSVSVAVVLVMVLCIIKVSSNVEKQSGRSDENQGQSGTVQAHAETTPVEQQDVPVAAPVPTPREKAVALTFDDGPSRAHTGDILNVLQKYGAHATFFVVGDRARVDGDILQMELAAGCEIGSHSWNHPQLSKIKWKRVERQLRKTNKTVSKLTNGYEIQLLRPPYGSISGKMRKKLDMPMILWVCCR